VVEAPRSEEEPPKPLAAAVPWVALDKRFVDPPHGTKGSGLPLRYGYLFVSNTTIEPIAGFGYVFVS
jgi:hypothetical protein